MRMITLTKKKVKRLTAIGLLAAATAAAGVGASAHGILRGARRQ